MGSEVNRGGVHGAEWKYGTIDEHRDSPRKRQHITALTHVTVMLRGSGIVHLNNENAANYTKYQREVHGSLKL